MWRCGKATKAIQHSSRRSVRTGDRSEKPDAPLVQPIELETQQRRKKLNGMVLLAARKRRGQFLALANAKGQL